MPRTQRFSIQSLSHVFILWAVVLLGCLGTRSLAVSKVCELGLGKAAELDAAIANEVVGARPIKDSYDVTVHFFKKGNSFTAKEQALLDQQAASIWEFLKEYHTAVGGKTDVPFGIRGVEVRPIDEAPGKREFSVQDGKIILGVKKNLLGRYKTLSPQEIRDLWEAGAHFPNVSLLKKNPMKRVWPFVNPTGQFRYSMKQVLNKLQKEAIERVDQGNEAALRKLAGGKLDNVSDAEIARIREKWVAELKNPDGIDSVLNAAVERVSASQTPDYKVNLSSYGINIGNIHDIDISVKSTNQNLVGEAGDRPKIEVNSKGGLINVYTIDRIHVELDLNGSLENWSLARVLDRPL